MNAAHQAKTNQATRLAELRRQSGLSQREVAAKVGVSDPRISHYEADPKAIIKMPVLRKLAQLYKTSVEYIETGQHPSPADEAGQKKSSGPSEFSYIHPATLEEYLILPAVPVKARATFAEGGADYEYGELDTMRAYNPSAELRKPGSIAIQIDGDSMEPQLRSGMWVGAYPLDPGDFKYASSGVYVVDYGSSVVIKRIKDNDLLRHGTLTLHSDNPLAGSVVIESQDLRRLWKVVDIIAGRVV